MRALTAFAAVDLGASSGRVMLGRVGPDHSDHIELTEVHRFRNGGVRLPDGLYWDVLGLYTDVLTGLRAAAREEQLAGVAVDSWAVDYGLLDARGTLQGNPRHYRDPRTDAVIDDVHAKLDPARLYGVTGLQFLPFNTLYQLAAEPALDGRRALLVPDLLGYWLTGQRVAGNADGARGEVDVDPSDPREPADLSPHGADAVLAGHPGDGDGTSSHARHRNGLLRHRVVHGVPWGQTAGTSWRIRPRQEAR